MKDIEYAAPRSLDEAAAILNERGSRARPLAGGTDIIVQVREGRRDIDILVDVKKIPELSAVQFNRDEGLTLGAAVPCYQIYNNAEVAQAYPGLIDAAILIGAAQIQGRASFGGNLCNASPAADTICPLIVHSAVCSIYGPDGSRAVPVEEFCSAPGQTVLKQGEFLVSIALPPPKPSAAGRYLRFIPRNEMDIAVAGAAAYVELENGMIGSARVALAAVAPTPLFVAEIGERLADQDITDETLREAGEIARAAARPIDDMRGTVEHRKELCAVLTRRALKGAIERAQENA